MQQPAPIIALEESVVHRIAAGEVIQRPASAIKEMLENSLDAGARHITVTVKEGGIKLLQIQDDGCGVRLEDLPILCRRHTTSKLRSFEDLDTISTLGFRGEALASISYVAHVSVTTMTEGKQHGFKASYRDGDLLPPGAKPVAAVKGTIITVEDMFYNVPARRKAFRSHLEEHNLISDIIQRYAVFKAGVGFTLRRQGEPRADLHTLPGASRLDTIRSLYGSDLSGALLPLQLQSGTGFDDSTGVEAPMAYCAEGFISGLTYVGRKSHLLLFINGRPVECGQLKRSIEAQYLAHNPKASKPWLFMDLRLPSRHVEVNMHPTKKEVGFLHQDEVIDSIAQGVSKLLASSMNSRSFATAKLSGTAGIAEQPTAAGAQQAERDAQAGPLQPTQPSYYRPEKLVRSDHRAQTMDAFVVSQPSATATAAAVGAPRKRSAAARDRSLAFTTADPELAAAQAADVAAQRAASQLQRQQQQQPRLVKQRRNPEQLTELTSIRELLAEAALQGHEVLAQVFRDHVWVGMATSTQALLQHGTKLYLVDITALSTDMFYQQVLRRFEQCQKLRLTVPLPVRSLIMAALQLEEAAGRWQPEDGPHAEIADLVVELLRQKAPMLAEYFGIQFEHDCLATLPVLVDGYLPDLSRTPDLLLALSRDVDWGDEKLCFQGIAQALADLYAVLPLSSAADLAEAQVEPPASHSEQQDELQLRQQSTGGGIDFDAMAETVDDAAEQEQQPQQPVSQAVAAPTDALSAHINLEDRAWTVRHVLMPSFKMFLNPSSKRARDGSVVLLTSMEKLYRVFERCM